MTPKTIRNLTPFPIAIYAREGLVRSKRGNLRHPSTAENRDPLIVFMPDGIIARALAEGGEETEALCIRQPLDPGPEVLIPVCSPRQLNRTSRLPLPAEGVMLLVTWKIGAAAVAEGRDCSDILTVGEEVCNDLGAVIGYANLRRVVVPTGRTP